MLQNKRILVGITGGIASYKCCELVRLLVKNGAAVQVIMTPDATKFVSEFTLGVISKNKVHSSFFNESGEWNNHVDFALNHDLIVIAPATANTIAKMAMGLCDNLLTAIYLSAKCPIMIAPAMDLDMYQHATVKQNLEKLLSYGHHIIPAENGELASGLIGQGRMAEPTTILSHIEQIFNKESSKLKGKKVLVAAGPTYEAIDPVRFIGNHSSGKMGIALADSFAAMGADVTLVCGPSSIAHNHFQINRIDVVSADEMYDVCLQNFASADITVMSAAVADYKPMHRAAQKIKKADTSLHIELVKNKDILAAMGAVKTEHQLLVGFALETENEKINAQGKLIKKNLDFIVLNSLNDKGAGFGGNTNQVTIIGKNEMEIVLPLMSKSAVAEKIIETILK